MTKKIEIAISRNGAQTFGDWTLHPIGDTGEFKHPYVIRRRCGIGREFVAKTKFTEARNITLLAVAIEAE